MKKRLLSLFLFMFILASFAVASDPKIDSIISKIREQQNLIKDMSADIVTVMKTDGKDKKSMEQKGSIKMKGNDKSKMEITSPFSQITITNKNKVAMVNPVTGQKMVQDISKIKGANANQNPLDQTRILDYFNLSLEEKGIIFKSYVITGVPKEKSKFLGQIKFYVDAGKNIPTKIEIYNGEGKLVTVSEIDYKKIKGIWVISDNKSSMDLPGGKMEVLMKFNNIKINEGIPDKEFEIK